MADSPDEQWSIWMASAVTDPQGRRNPAVTRQHAHPNLRWLLALSRGEKAAGNVKRQLRLGGDAARSCLVSCSLAR